MPVRVHHTPHEHVSHSSSCAQPAYVSATTPIMCTTLCSMYTGMLFVWLSYENVNELRVGLTCCSPVQAQHVPCTTPSIPCGMHVQVSSPSGGIGAVPEGVVFLYRVLSPQACTYLAALTPSAPWWNPQGACLRGAVYM